MKNSHLVQNRNKNITKNEHFYIITINIYTVPICVLWRYLNVNTYIDAWILWLDNLHYLLHPIKSKCQWSYRWKVVANFMSHKNCQLVRYSWPPCKCVYIYMYIYKQWRLRWRKWIVYSPNRFFIRDKKTRCTFHFRSCWLSLKQITRNSKT